MCVDIFFCHIMRVNIHKPQKLIMNDVSDKLQSGISEDDATNLLITMKKFEKEVSDCLS